MLRRLRSALGGKTQRTLFVDDIVTEGTEILPSSETAWCREQIAALAGRAAPRPSGYGDAEVRRPASGAQTIADMAIPFEAADQALAACLAPFGTVVTGDPNRPIPTAGRGYGPSPLSAVVVYAAGGSVTVTSLEVTLRGGAADNAAVLAAIGALPARESLIAVDWNRGQIAELADSAAIARFTSGQG